MSYLIYKYNYTERIQNHVYSKVFMEPNGKIETEISRREANKKLKY